MDTDNRPVAEPFFMTDERMNRIWANKDLPSAYWKVMKTLIVLFLALLGAPVEAAEIPELTFGSVRIEPSLLTLLESAKQRLPAVFKDSEKRLPGVRRKLISRMPIVEPQAGVDHRMPIKIPNPSIDYKLLVTKPAIESRKSNEP
jgi:hypothetical protein